MDAGSDAPTRAIRRRERWVVAALAAVAALRILAFAAAFPFFHNVDEHMHVDLVLKYARGFLPGSGDALFESETARYVIFLGSPEYLWRGEAGEVPGAAELRRRRHAQPERTRRRVAEFAAGTNIEAEAPPLYYAVAAAWYRLGRALGLGPLESLYWIRWIGALAGAALVAGTGVALRRRYPDDALMRLGPPALLAVFPNDLFYGVTADVLTPALGAATFFALVRLREGRLGAAGAAGAGLLLAAAFLNKYSNAVFVALAALLCAGSLREAWRARRTGPRDEAVRGLRVWAWTWGAAAVAVAPWLIHNLAVVGSLTGTHRKTARLEWAVKPLPEWLDHPLFTPAGWLEYLPRLVTSFWRGEFVWHRERLAHPAVDDAYALSTAVLLAAAAAAWVLRRVPARSRGLEGAALAICALGVLLLAGLSLPFEYAAWGAPTRELPYLSTGRLLGGAFAPFAILYVRGLRAVTAPLPGPAARVAAWGLLLAMVALCAGSEVALSRGVFASEYNWYHRGG